MCVKKIQKAFQISEQILTVLVMEKMCMRKGRDNSYVFLMQFERKTHVLKKNLSKLVLLFRLEKKSTTERFCAAIYLTLNSSFGKQ